MRIRELLQIELWSKRTSRKVLVGIGFAFAGLVLMASVLYEVELHWLTPSERNAARAALVEIDALQSAGSLNGDEFDLKEKKAQQKFDVARDAMRTYRDKEIVAALSTYFILTTYGWDKARFELEYPVATSSIDAPPSSTRIQGLSDVETRNLLRLALHKALE